MEETMATLGIPSNTIAILQKYNFTFQKKFGQNFLIDPHVLEKIVDAAGVTKEDCVVEIGPGIGTMTQYLACLLYTSHSWTAIITAPRAVRTMPVMRFKVLGSERFAILAVT